MKLWHVIVIIVVVLLLGFRFGSGRWPEKLSWLPFDGTGSAAQEQQTPAWLTELKWEQVPVDGGTVVESQDATVLGQVWDNTHPETASCFMVLPNTRVKIDGLNGSTPKGVYWRLRGPQDKIMNEWNEWPAKYAAQSNGLTCKTFIVNSTGLDTLTVQTNLVWTWAN